MKSVSCTAAVLFGLALTPVTTFAQVLLLDNNGTALGIYMGEAPFEKDPDRQDYYHSITENSYLFTLVAPRFENSVALSEGALANGTLSFETLDCTGQAFLQTKTPGMVFNRYIAGGSLATQAPEAWYVPKNEPIIDRELRSRRDFHDPEGCVETIASSVPSGRAYLNDPAETGFADTTPPFPFRFRSVLDPELARCLFRDSFECSF